jgi:sodium-dependent dicarboxylate transporter 2/3/5
MGRPRHHSALLGVASVATLAVLLAPTPPGLAPAGQAALATMTFAGVCWVTGALPLAVTALLVPVLLTTLGARPTFAAALEGFADPLIALFLGTFVLAAALSREGLDRRVALTLVAAVGTSPRRIVLALMVATAGLSMVISNTAAAAVMIPLALGLVAELDGGEERGVTTVGEATAEPDRDHSNLHVAALLGVAYAASIGGVGTVIGTPPNAIVVDALASAGVEVSFVDWLFVGLPIVVVTLPLGWAVLVGWLYPPRADETRRVAARDQVSALRADLPAVSSTGRRVAAVFVAVVVLWILGGLGDVLAPSLPAEVGEVLYGTARHQGLLYFPLVGLLAVPALYLVGGTDVEEIASIDWGTILLFGGGLALADALVGTGATAWLASDALGRLRLPLVGMIVVVVAVAILFSELASNTATAAILAPVLLEVGREGAAGAPAEAGVVLAVTGGIAANYGFALPVATPPNAIAFGTGEIEREEMLRAGVALDVLLGLVTAGLLLVLLPWVGVLG